MSDPQASALLVALQLGLMGLSWGCLALFVHEARPVILGLVGYSFTAAIGLALVSVPDVMARPATQTLGNLLLIGAVMLLCHSASALWSLPLPRLPMFALPLAGAALSVWFNHIDRDVFMAATAMMGTISWLLAALPWYIYRSVRREFGGAAACLLVACGTGFAAVLLAMLAQAWITGVIDEVLLSRPGRLDKLAVMMVAIFASNLAFAFPLVSRLVRRLDHLSRHDELTGLLNRRAMMEAVDQEWQRYQRHRTPFVLLALDVDHFKRINDGHGHPMGDEVLRRLSRVLGQALRRTDRLGRTGGEEFVVMLVGTDAARARPLAEALRTAVATAAWPSELSTGVTVSIGLAEACAGDPHVDELLTRADIALYQAKASGRNRVVATEPCGPAASAFKSGLVATR